MRVTANQNIFGRSRCLQGRYGGGRPRLDLGAKHRTSAEPVTESDKLFIIEEAHKYFAFTVGHRVEKTAINYLVFQKVSHIPGEEPQPISFVCLHTLMTNMPLTQSTKNTEALCF